VLPFTISTFLSVRTSGSCVRLLPRLPVSSILPSTSPSITCLKMQFLREMSPKQLVLSLYDSSPPWHCVILLHFWFQTSAAFWMLYYFFWVIPRRLSFKCRRFGTPCLFHLLALKMEQCSETSAFETQTPGNYPKEIIQHSTHGESLKSRTLSSCSLKYAKNIKQTRVISY
jgi:hypothetical protein